MFGVPIQVLVEIAILMVMVILAAALGIYFVADLLEKRRRK